MNILPKLHSARVAVIADYALYSMTNFVLGVSVARVANLAIYGVYALLFQLANFCLVMVRATLGETWLVTHQARDAWSDEPTNVVPTAYAAALGLALIPVFLLVTALLIDLEDHLGLVLAMALVLPALLAQDAHRFVCFSSQRSWRAVFSDASWLTIQGSLLAFMALEVLPFTPGWAAAAWTIGSYISLFTIGAVRHLHPYMAVAGFDWWKRRRRVGQHLVVETVGGTMVGPLIAVGLFVMGKDVALGVLRGASTLFSPILVFAQGMRTALTKRPDRHHLERLLGARTLLATTSMLWGAVLVTTPSVGRLILGGLWGPGIRQIVLLEAAARVGLASAAIDSARLRTRLATLTAATVGVWTGGLVVASALLGAFFGDFLGAAVGSATAYLLGAGVWRYICVRKDAAALSV